MLQQTSETRFNTSVGNLPPGKAVLITIVYVQKLEFVEGELEFVMPTTQFAPNGYGRTSLFTKPKHDTFDELVPYGVKVRLIFIIELCLLTRLKGARNCPNQGTNCVANFAIARRGHRNIIFIQGTTISDSRNSHHERPTTHQALDSATETRQRARTHCSCTSNQREASSGDDFFLS
jgi:hypothetical protein